MNVHAYERGFLWISGVLLFGCLAAVLYVSAARGMHLPGHGDTIADPAARVAFFALRYDQDLSTPIRLYARDEAGKLADEARKEEQTRRRELKDLEQRLVTREEAFDKKLDDLDKRTEKLRAAEGEVESLKDEIREIRKKQQEKLEKIGDQHTAKPAQRAVDHRDGACNENGLEGGEAHQHGAHLDRRQGHGRHDHHIEDQPQVDGPEPAQEGRRLRSRHEESLIADHLGHSGQQRAEAPWHHEQFRALQELP